MKQQRIRLPQNLIQRLSEILPYNRLEATIHVFSNKRPTTIRANTLKISGADLRRQLLELGIKADTVFWNRDAFIIGNRTLRDIESLDLYKKGFLYVQTLSSMIPAMILDPKPGEKILDMAAAPGSKTTQMAALMRNTGAIIANEPNHIRLQKLFTNLNIQGITNVELVSCAGEDIYKSYPDSFDKVLVDAPCSGEGRMCVYYPDSFRYWSMKNVLNYSKLQKRLLISALQSVKPGGRVVYSTCTLAPEENEETINFILDKAKDFVTLEEIMIKDFPFSQPKSEWNGIRFSPKINKVVRILPTTTMEGFFIASIKRRR